jgi:membrane-bound lytic murein transglycosylase B
MGWGQFMPSSYRQYAVDGDGDGKRDLFGNVDDVVESVANYFVKKGGWTRGGVVMGPALRDPGTPDYNAEAIEAVKPVEAFEVLGYHTNVPAPATAPVQVIRLDGMGGTEYWMVFDNFRAITKYNTSRLYATAVHQLAESIAGRADAVATATQQATAQVIAPVGADAQATQAGATPP